MTTPSYRTPPAELAAIHAAMCRARRQGLACGTHSTRKLAQGKLCSNLAERAGSAAVTRVEDAA